MGHSRSAEPVRNGERLPMVSAGLMSWQMALMSGETALATKQGDSQHHRSSCCCDVLVRMLQDRP